MLNIEDTEKSKRRAAPLIFGLFSLLLFILMLISSEVAIEYMKKGLKLCVATVIPSLFPFMIVSELVASSGVGVSLSKIFAKPMRLLFNVSEGGASTYILGALCGFPIGAKTAVSMYDRGLMTKAELERLLTFCNNPGSAFVISAVGVSLLGDESTGIMLYICVIISSLMIGFAGKFLFRGEPVPYTKTAIRYSCDVKTITDAVQSSAVSMLGICAYVVFFSVLVGCIGAILSHFSVPCEIVAIISGFFEISSGMGAAVDVSNGYLSIILCALFAGWSGLSVHFQIISVCSGRGINFKPYIIAKAAQGVICAALMALCLRFIFPLISSEGSLVFSPKNNGYSAPALICTAFFFAALMPIILNILSSAHNCEPRDKFFTKKSQKNEKRY